MIVAVLLLAIAAVLRSVYFDARSGTDETVMLEDYRDRNVPIIIVSKHKHDKTLEVRRADEIELLEAAGNQILTAKDVHVIAWAGVDNGRSLAALSEFEYELHVTRRRMEILTAWQMKVHRAGADKEADLRGQFNWEIPKAKAT